jgi:hypothetical protein
MLLDGPSAERSGIVAAQQDDEQILRLARSEADGIRAAARQRSEASAAELVQEAVAAA